MPVLLVSKPLIVTLASFGSLTARIALSPSGDSMEVRLGGVAGGVGSVPAGAVMYCSPHVVQPYPE